MSRRSVEAGPAHRAAANLILISIALLLAVLSGRFEPAADQQGIASQTVVGAEQPVATDRAAVAPRGLFTASPEQDQARRYHSNFETSDAAGALGFWILISLCATLLTAAAAPLLLHRIRRTN